MLGRPATSNCGTPTEKISEFLDSQMKLMMQGSWSYIKDSGDFIRKIKNLTDIPKGAFLVTTDVMGLYPSIPHRAGKTLDEGGKAETKHTNKADPSNPIARAVLETYPTNQRTSWS